MHKLILAVLLSAIVSPATLLASSEGGHNGHHKEWSEKSDEEKRAEINGHIAHHVQDSYEFILFSSEKDDKQYGFSLPVILWDEGLHIFSGGSFEHGHKVVESNGKYYRLYHNKIYRVEDAEGHMEFDEEHHPTNAAPLDLSITKNVFSSILIAIVIFLIFRGVAKAYRNTLSPTRSAKFFEPLILFVRDEIAKPNIGEKHYARYMPYLLTIFFFIWIVNLFGLTPLGINVTGNIAVTACLAVLTFIITQVSGKKDYWMHIFWMPGVPIPMKIILAPIELLGVFIKPFALMIRLYANILAGHIVLMSLIALIFLFDNWFARGAFFSLSFLLSIIELLVAFLQAYIFTMLTALYFGSAVEEHDHDHAHAH